MKLLHFIERFIVFLKKISHIGICGKSGGISDPRNGTMLKMFNLIDIGERAGSGIPNIFRVWREEGWAEPSIVESYEPDRITLLLHTQKSDDKKRR